jgi:ABC-2 type transport system permease protein
MKYLTIFAGSWQNEFIYRLNFVLWRARNVLRLLMTYFLWLGVFSVNAQAFGYNQPQMLAYVFMVLVVQSLVLSAPSADNIGGEIANGNLSNYLVKPISYMKYWFTRDLASKFLNIIFAIVEITILWILLKPQIVIFQNYISIIGWLIACALAIVIYFLISTASRFIAFWAPENTWGVAFLIIIFIEVVAGGIFPLDVLPKSMQVILQFTPFPYLIYYPIAIFVGKITGLEMVRILLQSAIWLIVLLIITSKVWKAGLRVYGAEGR